MRRLTIITLLMMMMISCADYDYQDDNPPEPVDLSIISVTDSTVKLKWSQYTGDDFKNYRVYYNTKDVVDTGNTLSGELVFRFDTTKTVDSLLPNHRYYFRVMVNTLNDMLSASNKVDTVTLKGKSITALILEAVSVSDSAVSLKWSKDSRVNLYKVFMDSVSKVDSTSDLKASVKDTFNVIKDLDSVKTEWFKVYGFDSDSDVVAESPALGVAVGK